MLLSQVEIEDLKKYANVYHNDDDSLFAAILAAGKAFIKNYTGIDDDSILDGDESLSIVLMILSNEMYDNRAITVENDKVSFVAKAILDFNSRALL